MWSSVGIGTWVEVLVGLSRAMSLGKREEHTGSRYYSKVSSTPPV